MKHALLATLALCALALTGCSGAIQDSPDVHDAPQSSPTIYQPTDDVDTIEIHETMSNGDVIRCLKVGTVRGGISCDWNHPVSTASPSE